MNRNRQLNSDSFTYLNIQEHNAKKEEESEITEVFQDLIYGVIMPCLSKVETGSFELIIGPCSHNIFRVFPEIFGYPFVIFLQIVTFSSKYLLPVLWFIY